MTQEALKLALEKIATVNAMDYEYQAWAREALAQEQEPVVKLKTSNMLLRCHRCGCSDKLNIQIEYTLPPRRTWVDLTDEQLRTEFGKLYPNDIGILELSEKNRDFAVEAIGARHHWVAFQAGARAAEAKLKEKNT